MDTHLDPAVITAALAPPRQGTTHAPHPAAEHCREFRRLVELVGPLPAPSYVTGRPDATLHEQLEETRRAGSSKRSRLNRPETASAGPVTYTNRA